MKTKQFIYVIALAATATALPVSCNGTSGQSDKFPKITEMTEHVKFSDYELHTHYTFVYDAYGHAEITVAVKYIPNDGEEEASEIKYLCTSSNNGRSVRMEVISSISDEGKEHVLLLEYDDKGQLVTVQMRWPEVGSVTSSYTWENGKIVHVQENPDVTGRGLHITTYDKNGNWEVSKEEAESDWPGWDIVYDLRYRNYFLDMPYLYSTPLALPGPVFSNNLWHYKDYKVEVESVPGRPELVQSIVEAGLMFGHGREFERHRTFKYEGQE